MKGTWLYEIKQIFLTIKRRMFFAASLIISVIFSWFKRYACKKKLLQPVQLSVLLGWSNAIKVWTNAIQFQFNTNTIKIGFLHPTKCLEERILKYSYLVSIILNNQFPKTMFADFFVLIWILIALAHTLISLAHTLISLAHTLIAFAHT